MPPSRLFDSRSSDTAKRRAQRIGGDIFLARAAAEGIADRLEPVTRKFARGFMVGGPVPDTLKGFAAEWQKADFDADDFLNLEPESFDLALSVFSLQTVNDLPGALIQMRRTLKPDGLFLGAIFAGSTLHELRESFAAAEAGTLGGISPRVAPFGDVRDLGGLLQRAGFALPVADLERTLVRYSDVESLVRDLRSHGLSNSMTERRRRFLPRRTWAALRDYYAAHHAAQGKLNATFETVYLMGWAPHESQQKPLKPGSAKARLSDALGTVEQSAGEKPVP